MLTPFSPAMQLWTLRRALQLSRHLQRCSVYLSTSLLSHTLSLANATVVLQEGESARGVGGTGAGGNGCRTGREDDQGEARGFVPVYLCFAMLFSVSCLLSALDCDVLCYSVIAWIPRCSFGCPTVTVPTSLKLCPSHFMSGFLKRLEEAVASENKKSNAARHVLCSPTLSVYVSHDFHSAPTRTGPSLIQEVDRERVSAALPTTAQAGDAAALGTETPQATAAAPPVSSPVKHDDGPPFSSITPCKKTPFQFQVGAL